MKVAQNRVRIVDVADALGLSTATVSNVIHGKTSKISDETVKRVFVMSALNALSHEVNKKGYFLMIKTTADIRKIPIFGYLNHSLFSENANG